MAVRNREDDVFPNAAGIDVGGSSHCVAVPARSNPELERAFGGMTDDLNAMATWLLACGVDTVALESIGVYWKAAIRQTIGNNFSHRPRSPQIACRKSLRKYHVKSYRLNLRHR